MKDIDILNINNTNSKAELTISGDTISGIKLLAQRVLLALLTDIQGVLRESEGSEAFGVLSSYNNNTTYASLLLSSSIATITPILSNNSEDYDDSEILDSISIQNISMESGYIDFTILVTNIIGDSDTISSTTGVSI